MKTFNFNMPLNEARDFSKMTVDKATWLSISSIISKNRADEAENVKPMKKLTKDDLVNRYAAALVCNGKACPQSEADMDTLRTFKNYGHEALRQGATMAEIQKAYRINAGLEEPSAAPAAATDNNAASSDPMNNIEVDIDDDKETQNIINRINGTKKNDTYDDHTSAIQGSRIQIRTYDDIDPDDTTLNSIIKNGMEEIDDDNYNEEAVKKFIGNSRNNVIECPVKRNNYNSDNEFIDAFNEYLDDYSNETVKSDRNLKGKVGYSTKKYLDWGDLVKVDGIYNGDLYIVIDSDDPRKNNTHKVIPMNMEMFKRFNPWHDNYKNIPEAEVSDAVVAGKLVQIFKDNGIDVKDIYVNDIMGDEEDD